jgi:vacuolar protein sorting-associated protein 72
MGRLLEAEDDDDFYKTTYGGFTEEADDNDYQTEESGSEGTDSDIDLDENDEVKSDGEDDGETKRKRRLVTKAYKEPKKTTTNTDAPPTATVPRPKVERIKPEKLLVVETAIDKTSLRRSTAEKSRSTEDCVREREARMALMRQIADRKRVSDVRRLTQEELLAEAKITEKINLRSLETYQKLELEKKKARIHRQTYLGPVIRYRSVTVPVVEEPALETEINVDTDTTDGGEHTKQPRTTGERCSRTFITFSDEQLYRKHFPRHRPPRPAERSTCPVTGLPAVYFDPLTQLPYATAEAFKIIRQSYEQQLAADGEVTESSGEMSRPRLRNQTVA